jgi:hypothetical protein
LWKATRIAYPRYLLAPLVFLIDLGKYPSNTPSSLLVRSGV